MSNKDIKLLNNETINSLIKHEIDETKKYIDLKKLIPKIINTIFLYQKNILIY